MESEGEVEKLSKAFLKNRTHWELYIPYTLNRQFSESTLNSYEMIRKFFDVTKYFSFIGFIFSFLRLINH